MDELLVYFVDCGDHDPNTLSDGDLFGTNNSLTDRIYGMDIYTGYSWGVVTDDTDARINKNRDLGVYTAYQWADDSNTNDGLPKTESFRYSRDQLESGISPRYVKYMFRLEAGTYEVEVCMGNVWSNSANPDIFLNDLKINSEALAIPIGSNKVVVGSITIEDGEDLLVSAISKDPTINMNYIIIRKPSTGE